MDSIRNFRKCNKISQVALAEYLSVTQGFISQIEKELCPTPDWVISKILENPHGWDTSMLVESQPKLVAEQIPSLSNVEILLRDMLAEERAKNDALQELIWELKEENGRLKEQLRAKGGDAQDAVGSSSAVA